MSEEKEDKLLSVARKVAQKELLCHMARQNCLMMIGARIYLDAEVVSNVCKFVSYLCKECDGNKKCLEQSKLCYDASMCLIGTMEGGEEAYLKLCKKAVDGCPYGKPEENNNGKRKYIA